MAVKKKIARHGNDVEWIDGVDGLELRTSIRPGTPRNYFELQLWGVAPEIVAETETGDRLRITCERDDDRVIDSRAFKNFEFFGKRGE